MRRGLRILIAVGGGTALVNLLVMATFMPFVGAQDAGVASEVAVASILLTGFFTPVLMSLDWWVTLGLLWAAFRLAHRRGNA